MAYSSSSTVYLIQNFNKLNLKTNLSQSNHLSFILPTCAASQSQIVVHPMLDETVIEEVYTNKFLQIHLDRGLKRDRLVDSAGFTLASDIYVRNIA